MCTSIGILLSKTMVQGQNKNLSQEYISKMGRNNTHLFYLDICLFYNVIVVDVHS